MTFHSSRNYGAVLQCFALQEVLKHYCQEVETIDFSNELIRSGAIPNSKGLKSIVRRILSIRYKRSINNKKIKFDKFVSDYISLTTHYETIEELRSMPPKADIVFTGSDQVFNPYRRGEEIPVYYLDFPCKYRASYAASFGNSIVPEKQKDLISNYLSRFDSISVREDYGARIVYELIGRKTEISVDPVFLLNKEKWAQLEEPYRGLPENYILIFNLRESDSKFLIGKQLKKKTKLPIVLITGKPNVPYWCDYVLRDVGPKEFLWLIDHCDFFLEDSFHGTAFSIIFEKQFLFCDDYPKSYERGRTLLDKIDLSCAYDIVNWDSNLIKKYDYDAIKKKLEEMILPSINYIEMVIGEVERKSNK